MNATVDRLFAGQLAQSCLRKAAALGPEAAAAAAMQQLAGKPAAMWLECARLLIQGGAPEVSARLLDHACRSWPQDQPLRYWLANALRMSGDHAAAETQYRSVLARHPDHEDAAISLAMMLRDAGRLNAACETVLELERHLGGGGARAIKCAQFLWECRRADLAAEVCEAAVAAGGRDPALLLFAGRMALNLGYFERAQERLLAAYDAAPEQTEALLLLAHSRRYGDAQHPHFQRFAGAWAKAGLPRPARAAAGFALGKARDDVGDFAGAAAVLRQANALAAAGGSWNLRQWQHFVEGQTRLSLPRLPSAATDMVPVFIIGLPRTGTTLVADLLGRSPQLRNRGELNWLSHLYQRLAEAQSLHSTQALQTLQQRYAGFLRADDAPARWYVDKNPLNFRYLALIDAAFPKARVIHCRRGIRDTALSIWSQLFAHPDNGYSFRFADIAGFAAGYEQIMMELSPRLRVPMLEVQYENLVSAPAATMRAVSDFLELSQYDPFGLPASVDHAATASVWQVRQPVYQRSKERWRHYAPHLPELLQAFPGD